MSTQSLPVVLVHGAWMGASAWDRLVAELRARQVPVTAVELPGHGADTTPVEQLTLTGYVDAVIAALPSGSATGQSAGRAVVVGHSLAGMVISAVAEAVPEKLARLVFVSAYLPRDGESLYQLSQQDADSLVPRYWRQEHPESYSPASIAAEGIAEVFAADASPVDQQWLVRTHRPEALGPMATPVHLTAERYGRVPRVYVHTRQDRAVSFALQQQMVTAAGAMEQVVSLDTSHVPMLTQTSALADVIVQAAGRGL